MNTEIICTIVTAGGVVLSSLISFFVARSTANREIRRMKLTWDREDAVTADKEFSSMSAAVAEYGAYGSIELRRSAVKEIAALRAKENGPIAPLLDKLHMAVLGSDLHLVNDLLSRLIEHRRQDTLDPKTSHQ